MPGKPFLIGVAGGTSSGKTSVCTKIVELLESTTCDVNRKVAIINQESFHKHLTKDEMNTVQKNQYNFDHPDAFDTKLMKSIVYDIIAGKKVSVPIYDPHTNSRIPGQYNCIQDCDVVIFEGILVFYHKEIRDLFNMKLFVDIDADTRLSRRVLRDINGYARSLESILQQYTNFVKPAFEEFCLPTKKYADIIIPRGVENTVAINLIVHHLSDILNGGTGIKYTNGQTKSKSNTKSVSKLHNGDAVINGICDEVEAISMVRH